MILQANLLVRDQRLDIIVDRLQGFDIVRRNHSQASHSSLQLVAVADNTPLFASVAALIAAAQPYPSC